MALDFKAATCACYPACCLPSLLQAPHGPLNWRWLCAQAAVAAQHAAIRARQIAHAAAASEPVQHCLMDSVLPSLMAGLAEVVRERPSDPAGVLVQHLRRAAEQTTERLCDPYADPRYTVQMEKWRAKDERNAARVTGFLSVDASGVGCLKLPATADAAS